MNCDEAQDLRIDSLMDRTDPDEAARLDEHESGCPSCAASAQEMKELWNAVARLEPPPQDSDSLVRFGRQLERRRGSTKRSTALLAAGIAALVLGGAALGRWSAPAGETDSALVGGPQFLLLLRGNEPDRRVPQGRLVREYGAWAGELAAGGALVSAAQLADDARWAEPAEEAPARAAGISGYFLVRAAGYDSAVALALASPHVTYGGSVEVRQVLESR